MWVGGVFHLTCLRCDRCACPMPYGGDTCSLLSKKARSTDSNVRNITERTHGVDGATWHARHSVFVGYSKPVPYLAAKAEAVQKAAIVGR